IDEIRFLDKKDVTNVAIQHGVEFSVMSPPVKADFKDAIADINFGNTKMAGLLDRYVSNILFIEEANFIDEIHLKSPEVFRAKIKI
ncbi:MAG: hypothetical protein AAFO94_18580, partial [Bacteroidota bacterium]